MTGGGGGGRRGPSDFFRSEILVKSDFFRFMKDARISLGRKTFLKDQRDFFAYSKTDVIFLGRQILKLGFFLVQNMNLCRTPPPPRH